MDFSSANAHLVDVQNELNLLAAEAMSLEQSLVQTQNALAVANARIAELEAQQPQPQPEPTPQRVVLFGASTPPNSRHGTSSREAESRWFEQRMGRKLGITRHYVKATNDWTGDGAAQSIVSGRNIMLTFTSGGRSWSDVAVGALDSYVEAQCQKLMALGFDGSKRHAFVAFANEPEADGMGGPDVYTKAANRVLRIINQSTIYSTSALMEFSWQPGSGRDAEAWVPEEAHWLGVHGYSTRVGSCGEGARSFVDTFDGPHATAEKLGKRMGIWEAGYATKAGTSPQIKADFFRSIPKALLSLPLVDAYTYWNNSGGRCDYPNSYFIDSSPEALQGWVDAGKALILGGA